MKRFWCWLWHAHHWEQEPIYGKFGWWRVYCPKCIEHFERLDP